jgi:hypothetical protein
MVAYRAEKDCERGYDLLLNAYKHFCFPIARNMLPMGNKEKATWV